MTENKKEVKIASGIVLALLLIYTIYSFIFSFRTIKESVKNVISITSVNELKEVLSESSENIGDHVAFHDRFIDGYGLINRILGKNEINNFGIITDEVGMMYYGSVYVSPLDDVDEIVDNTARLADMVHEQGKDFVVVLPPSKILYGVSEVDCDLPLNNPNPRMDKYLWGLQQRQIDTIDLRNPFVESGLPIEELFFKTDHHWTAQGAFIGTSYFVDKLNEKYGYNLDPDNYYRNLDNYNIVRYYDKMLGTHGRNSGLPYSGVDDFDIITLKDFENTDFSYEDKDSSGNGDYREGTAIDALYDWVQLDDPTDYKQNLYAIYLHSITSHETMINRNNPDGLKVVVCRDSYFSPMTVFMAPMVGEVDLYYGQDAEGKEGFLDRIEEGDYDLVVLEIYPYNIKYKTVDLFGDD